MLNPLLMLCILTLEHVEPLVDLMHAYPEHVCPLDHLFYHLLSGMMINIMTLCQILLLMLSPCVLILSMYDPLDTSIIISLEV
jgi:hypothetical protein